MSVNSIGNQPLLETVETLTALSESLKATATKAFILGVVLCVVGFVLTVCTAGIGFAVGAGLFGLGLLCVGYAEGQKKAGQQLELAITQHRLTTAIMERHFLPAR